MTASYLQHLERHLGKVSARFVATDQKLAAGLQLLAFKGTPFPEASAVATLGLSAHVLAQQSGVDVRQELVACTYHRQATASFAALVEVVASDVLQSHRALQRGQVLGPSGPIVKGSTLEALVCCSPWYWADDQFAGYDGLTPEVVVVWLLPISADEAAFVREQGIDAFEDLLNEAEADLLDLKRASVV